MKVEDQAIGSWEAAAVMGVHFTQPAVKAKKGLLTLRTLRSPRAKGDERVFALYSLRECEGDYRDYEASQATAAKSRPRNNLSMRAAELRRLSAMPVKIAFADAIGVGEAAEIMKCHVSWPPRLARAGEIEGRIVKNGRAGKVEDRLWIFSRASCERNAAQAQRLVQTGKKVGRPRRSLKKK